MKMLSDDDLNLKDMSNEELDRAWDLWFTLAQSTNDADPPYTHGVFVNLTWDDVRMESQDGSAGEGGQPGRFHQATIDGDECELVDDGRRRQEAVARVRVGQVEVLDT